MVAVPHCLEYYRLPESYEGSVADKKDEGEGKKALEILLVGDDLGICHMYKFTFANWHYCTYNENQRNVNPCHKNQIEAEFAKMQSQSNDKSKAKGKAYHVVMKGVEETKRRIHKGWITKIKFY